MAGGDQPRDRARSLRQVLGQPEFALACARTLEGEWDEGLACALGGPASGILEGVHRRDQRYWARVWAARGLLWEWDDVALGAVRAATHDDHWRVREMACRVVARHRLEGALEDVASRRGDPVARVRAAAERAFVAILSGDR